jgi:hypothetical protein
MGEIATVFQWPTHSQIPHVWNLAGSKHMDTEQVGRDGLDSVDITSMLHYPVYRIKSKRDGPRVY